MTKNKFTVKDLTQISLFTALTSILALISIPLPFSPVPVSGQTLGVMLSGAFLGARKGAISIIIYIILGSIGLPIFAGGSSGIGILFGPTGGYLWGFIIGAYIIGKLFQTNNRGIVWNFISLLIGGVFIIYLFGMIQLILVTKMSFVKALSAGVLPFIPGGIFKIIVALLISQRISINRSSSS